MFYFLKDMRFGSDRLDDGLEGNRLKDTKLKDTRLKDDRLHDGLEGKKME